MALSVKICLMKLCEINFIHKTHLFCWEDAINIFVPPAPAMRAPINHIIPSDNWYHLEGTFFFLCTLSETVYLQKYKFVC